LRVELFDFELPGDRIALHPVRPRDAARMLCVARNGALADRTVHDLPDLLDPGDLLVVNDTRVIPAALKGVRDRDGTAASISVNLTERLDASTWAALARPAKRLRPGDRIRFGATVDRACALTGLDATVGRVGEGGEVILGFDLAGPALDEAVKSHGAMPLPPYIGARRPVEPVDATDYQTVYAREEGAVAAPTAGLHFTEELLDRIRDKGVETAAVTLHVGPGTFLPVTRADTDGHRMHAERGEVSAATAEAVNETRRRGGRIVAVGTTSVRLLESVAAEDGTVRAFSGETDLFITPGFRFRVVDVLMTNFHLPRSTLFMLVCAFLGTETMQRAYAHAIAEAYRFYSYGDACLLNRAADAG